MKRRSGTEDGFTLAALIVMVSVLAIMLTAAAPVYRQQVHRELEEELIFRGEEYVRAILKYQRQFGVYPPDLESLLETNGIRFLRRAYVDPITGEEFRLLTANPAGGIEGSVLYPSGTTPLFESGPLINSGANSGGNGGVVGPQSEGGRGGGRGGGGLPGSGFQSGFGESSALDSSRSGGQSGGFQSSFGGFEGGGFGPGTGGGGQGGLGTSGGFGQPAGGGGQGSFGAPGGFGLGTGGAGQGGFGGRGGQGAEGRPAGFAPPGTFPQSGGRGGQGEGGRGGRGGNAAGGFGGGVNEFTQIGGGGVPQGAVLSGLVGVAPVNEAQSIKFYNGRNVYYEWEFLALPQVLNPQSPLAAPDLNSGQPPAFNQGQAPSSPGTGFNSFGGQP